MPETVKTIKPAGGGDYSTIQSWEAALSANPTDDQVAECYAGDCFGGSGFTFDVSNSNSVRLVIRAASGESFREQGGWDTSMYDAVAEGAWLGNDAGGINILTTKVFIEDMGIHISNTAHNFGVGGELTINRCFVYRTRLQANKSDDLSDVGDVHIWNTVWVTYGTACIWARESGCTVEIINSTVAQEPGQSAIVPIYRTNGTMTVKNVWCIGGSTCFDGTMSGDYNGSSDGTAPGTNYQRNITITDWFIANGATDFDYHLKTAKLSDFLGTNESATIGSTDIDNQTRTTYPVGADWGEVSGHPAIRRLRLMKEIGRTSVGIM